MSEEERLNGVVRVQNRRIDALEERAQKAEARVRELEALFQATHNVHWSWVARERELREKIDRALTIVSDTRLCAGDLADQLQEVLSV